MEKVKEIKEALELNKYFAIEYFSKSGEPKIFTFTDLLTLINELESENEALWKGVKRLKKRYKETITKNADECVKKFCETVMYKEQDKLVNETQQLKDRIAELEKENKDYYDRFNNLQAYIDNHEEIWKGNTNNALKKFAKRLKEISCEMYLKEQLHRCIDETLKEFINGKV